MDNPVPSPGEAPDTIITGADRYGWMTLGALFPITPVVLKLPFQVSPWAYFSLFFGAIGLVAAATGKPRSIVNITLLVIVVGILGLLWLLLLAIANDQRSQIGEAVVKVFCVGLPLSMAMIYLCAVLKPWWLRYSIPLAAYVLAMPVGALFHSP